ncbi:MAG: TIGR03667 family PPOX class F420-dependent oxidoreductase [Candidatus Dormiibacterota bacterium]
MAAQLFDPTTPFGQRVARRLDTEPVIWLTSVGQDGTPQPNPVWFLWEGDSFVVYSAGSAHRNLHVRQRPRVSLHFDSDGKGSDIVVFLGTAEPADDLRSSDQNRDYQAKYGESIRRGPWKTAERFDRDYPVKLRIRVERIRGW